MIRLPKPTNLFHPQRSPCSSLDHSQGNQNKSYEMPLTPRPDPSRSLNVELELGLELGLGKISIGNRHSGKHFTNCNANYMKMETEPNCIHFFLFNSSVFCFSCPKVSSSCLAVLFGCRSSTGLQTLYSILLTPRRCNNGHDCDSEQ